MALPLFNRHLNLVLEIEKRSLSFRSDTEKWKPVLRALRFSVHSVRYWNQKWFSKLFSSDWKVKTFDTGIRNGSLGFQIKILSNGSFSFLVDSPSVRVLGIRKRFLDFVSVSGFFDFGLEIWFAPGLGKLKHKFYSALKSETETFSSENGN
ncbi:hypothetical protein C1645_817873 [Glomus cerebriforme]|uniref:Uncharacterized protein n=1 Tax=Glomus cerebriforme TaxID=658196 RepID=A0A397T9H0_9GLOM|nr:hypothetical protein C1645_817873 [Glomus cerebriforme]